MQYRGDGYTSCEGMHTYFSFYNDDKTYGTCFVNVDGLTETAVGAGRCTVNNGGCWSDIRDGRKFSACSVECHLI